MIDIKSETDKKQFLKRKNINHEYYDSNIEIKIKPDEDLIVFPKTRECFVPYYTSTFKDKALYKSNYEHIKQHKPNDRVIQESNGWAVDVRDKNGDYEKIEEAFWFLHEIASSLKTHIVLDTHKMSEIELEIIHENKDMLLDDAFYKAFKSVHHEPDYLRDEIEEISDLMSSIHRLIENSCRNHGELYISDNVAEQIKEEIDEYFAEDIGEFKEKKKEIYNDIEQKMFDYNQENTSIDLKEHDWFMDKFNEQMDLLINVIDNQFYEWNYKYMYLDQKLSNNYNYRTQLKKAIYEIVLDISELNDKIKESFKEAVVKNQTYY